MARAARNRFGRTIRHLREKEGIGLRQMAAAIGISPTYLSQVELGGLPPPTEAKVEAIARVLKQEPDELVALAGRIPSDLLEIVRRRPREMAMLLRLSQDLEPDAIFRLATLARKLRT